ncbi:hypothetical protein HJC23_014088 [Cyclotella cryptica]|uniref:Uncharacterized protein n=1 Tax=Cyclotella cryptica TaxID=29204 RepID=A0ABD3QTI2_9STRA|eukprot:CCRYP_002499-RA/>CCRYP_002499-RA protein AED:0.08 eAED:0.08 QI:0/-1/0/1/-1/1/1/0/2223
MHHPHGDSRIQDHRSTSHDVKPTTDHVVVTHDEFGRAVRRSFPMGRRFEPPPQQQQQQQQMGERTEQQKPQSIRDRFQPPPVQQRKDPPRPPPPQQQHSAPQPTSSSSSFHRERFQPASNAQDQSSSSLSSQRLTMNHHPPKIHLKREGGTWRHFHRCIEGVRDKNKSGESVSRDAGEEKQRAVAPPSVLSNVDSAPKQQQQQQHDEDEEEELFSDDDNHEEEKSSISRSHETLGNENGARKTSMENVNGGSTHDTSMEQPQFIAERNGSMMSSENNYESTTLDSRNGVMDSKLERPVLHQQTLVQHEQEKQQQQQQGPSLTFQPQQQEPPPSQQHQLLPPQQQEEQEQTLPLQQPQQQPQQEPPPSSEQSQPQQQPPTAQHPTQQLSVPPSFQKDAEYTQALHWKKPTSKTMEKRPIALPNDVVHITEVEWAEDSPPPPASTSTTNTSNYAGTSLHNTHHPLHISNLEKAPKPKQKRPEPCFCEPDLHSQTMCCIDETCALYACQEECPANCPAGPLCGNERIQRKEWKKLQVFDAGLKGRGLMLAEDAKRGDFLCEYVGVAIRRQYLDGLFARYRNERMLYIMALDGDVYIDARHRGGIARYINHSCEPNCAVHRWRVRGIIRAGVFALRPIAAGEELSFDYQWDRKRGRAATRCYCGSEKCRGTLEMAKGDEERELEERLEGHWIEPKNKKVGREIMNRVIKVFFEDNDEYYVADVAQYDAVSGQHQLMYRDMDDCWTDLSKEKWMLLDDEGEKYAITRKIRDDNEGDSLLVPPPSHSTGTSPRSDSMSRSSSPVPLGPGVKVKNYVLVQTPVKDAMQARHTIFKCGRYCRVHIDVVHLPVGDSIVGDDDDLKKAMEESADGSVWKLVVTGMEVKKAIDYLEKMATIIQNGLNGTETLSSDLASKGNSSGQLADSSSGQNTLQTEMIIPRVIVDQVKKKFFSLKGYCYNVDVTFTHSDSKSKQFAKMILSADLGSDLERALEYLNKEMTHMCTEVDAPMTSIGVYKDLAYLGGELSNEDFRLLFESKRTLSKRMDCTEDLQGSTFAASFEEANRCSIWIQSEEDMGRVSNNVVINEAHPLRPRKIFFGVAPSRVPVLWTYLQGRIADLKRGVQFLNLGADRIYQPILLQPIKKNGRPGFNYFFDFVQKTSGASVRIDSITGNHLRIDGGDASLSEEAAQQVNEKVDIAMEMISLQIELLRDHYIRQQRWGFGRDWALLLTSDAKTLPQIDSSSTQDSTSLSKPHSPANTRSFDTRALCSACLEISEIVSGVGLSERVAAHACIIFYRYTSLPSNADTVSTTFKLRDVQLASLFIANKSQKVMKWKRLEAVLDHSYRVFYPGSYFNPQSEEAKNWERRVITAEKSVLSSLNYDVFWPDVDWVISAVVGTNALAEPIAENAMSLALSGPVLAAGPILWLKYGPKYAFAAIAGFLSLDLEKMFHALSLVPTTVSHAAELIYNSCQAMFKAKKSILYQSSRHEIFSESTMKAYFQKIQSDCAAYMNKYSGQIFSDSNFVASPEYRAISHRSRLRRVFTGVKSDIVEEKVLPILGKICFESKCNIRFSEGVSEGTHDIVLEGNWKALSIAEHLFSRAATESSPTSPSPNSYAAMSNSYSSYVAQDFNLPSDGDAIKQVKVQPGLLGMNKVSDKFGWEGTIECPTEYNSSEIYDAGHKTCIAAQASQEHLDAAGLRWWVPHQYGPSLHGSLCEIFSSPKILDNGSIDMRALALLAQSFTGGYTSLQSTFPTLASFLPHPEHQESQNSTQSIAISLQRWPPEKIETKEQSSSGEIMQMGFSVAALQEMQLLHQLHFLIPSPQGHPNFILPLAIALQSDEDNAKDSDPILGDTSTRDATEQILAMIERNQRAAGGKQHVASGSHLVLEPTPLVLQKVMNMYQRKNNGGSLIPPSILASWCNDLLSAILFCHSNHIILRSLLPDQIHIDHCGTAKLSGLSKVMVLHGNDRTKHFNPLKYVRDKKKSKDHNTEDVEPFAAPELLLGGTRHTKESDMWAFGALLANLLLGKQLFPGKDRVSKMTQVFKIVGVPSEDNFPDAKRFPFYSSNMYVIGEDNKKKKYSRGVEKAIRHMLKSFESGNIGDYSGFISLLDGVLHLDPKQRMTAAQALQHPFMVHHAAHVQDQEFRQSYVKDWLELKEHVLTRGKSSKAGENGHYVGIGLSQNGNSGVKESKRKAFIFEASSGDLDDDLYNLDDILGSSPKRPKNLDI